jgi:outer membrane lipoprotein
MGWKFHRIRFEKMRIGFFCLASLLALLLACAPISRQALRDVDSTISFQALIKDPEKYKGKRVLLGGQILTTTVEQGGTWVEVLQHPLDWRQRPEDSDVSHGRFLLRFKDLRDPAVYRKGRMITVLGEVQGQRIAPFQKIEYTYPVLDPRESYLWKSGAGEGTFFQFGVGVGVGR